MRLWKQHSNPTLISPTTIRFYPLFSLDIPTGSSGQYGSCISFAYNIPYSRYRFEWTIIPGGLWDTLYLPIGFALFTLILCITYWLWIKPILLVKQKYPSTIPMQPPHRNPTKQEVRIWSADGCGARCDGPFGEIVDGRFEGTYTVALRGPEIQNNNCSEEHHRFTPI